MTKKRIFILSGGTASAWHICNLIKECFADNFILYVGDINDRSHIPASVFSDKYFKLPLVDSPDYYGYMLNLFKKEKIDILVPLMDKDLITFSNDNPDLLKINILSTAPDTKLMDICKSKIKISKFLSSNGVIVPIQYEEDNIDPKKSYFVKPDEGFGSKGAAMLEGKDIDFSKKIIVQEILNPPEITVEVFKKDDFLSFVSRERLEVKSGVCTKARFFYDDKLDEVINRIDSLLPFPIASCVQFMKNNDNEWCITDLNMRLGAGTALSSVAGFGLTSAFLSVLSNKKDFKDHLGTVLNNQIVVRVYNEIKMPCLD